MKNLSIATIALAVATLTGGAAFAAEPVELGRVTLTAYADNGNTTEPTIGMKYKDLFPHLYSAPSSVTRGQVLAEFMASRANRDDGDAIEPNTGRKLRELHPAHFASSSTTVAKTRSEVRAEFMATRNASDAGDAIEPTTGRPMRTLFPNRYAQATTQAQVNGNLVAVNP
jgi:hypothetical protein